MAVTSTIEYCTDRDLQDIFPHLSEYDLKRRLYNWKTTDTSNQYQAFNTGLITMLYFDGIEGTAVTDSPNADYEFNYSETTDSVQVFHSSTNPNDMIMEAGDDWSDIKTRFRRKASRLMESHLDNRLSREVLKDREGNYPEIIVHITALQTVILLLKAHDPTSEVITPFQEELNEILDGLKAGSIVLPTAISGDSSKGVIREVSVNASSDLRPVELKGHYSGSGYELIKVYIDTSEGGIIGTTKMTVKGKSSTTLKSDTLVDSEIITGDFQTLGIGSMYIRWSGDDVTSAITTAADEYEIECWGSSLDATVSSVGSIRMTRR